MSEFTNVKPDDWYEIFYQKNPVKNYTNLSTSKIEGITWKEFDENIDNKKYWDIYNNWDFFLENNNRSRNMILINEFDEKLIEYRDNPYVDLYKQCKEERILLREYKRIFNEGYLITQQLYDVYNSLRLMKYTIYNNRFRKKNIFEQFKWQYKKNEIIELVKKEVKWRNIERDFEVYFEREKGRLLEEIATYYDDLNSKQAIEGIVGKVQGEINHYSGLLFERKYEKYLKSLDEFRDWKIERFGEREQPDIVLSKDNEKIVLSLKNLEIEQDKTKYVNKKDFKIERDYSLDQIKGNFDVKTNLVVFNNLNNITRMYEIDIFNPENIRVY